jgi:hypothetical protein
MRMSSTPTCSRSSSPDDTSHPSSPSRTKEMPFAKRPLLPVQETVCDGRFLSGCVEKSKVPRQQNSRKGQLAAARFASMDLSAASMSMPSWSSTLARLRRTRVARYYMPDAIFSTAAIAGRNWRMLRHQITLGQLRESGSGRLHVFCGGDNCSHSIVIDADCWPGNLRLSDVKELFVCSVCGHRGADVRPDDQEAVPGVRLLPARRPLGNIG